MEEELRKRGANAICPVILLLKDGRALAGRRHYTPEKWKSITVWTLPGGRCDEEERIGETLRREVAEETGITEFTITEFIGEIPGAKEGDVVPLFVGSTEQEPRLMEPEKFSEWKWVTKKFLIDALEQFNPKAGRAIEAFWQP